MSIYVYIDLTTKTLHPGLPWVHFSPIRPLASARGLIGERNVISHRNVKGCHEKRMHSVNLHHIYAAALTYPQTEIHLHSALECLTND